MKTWSFSNVAPLKDNKGKYLHSHGGHLLYAGDGYYYLYGEWGEIALTGHEGRKISCYRSRDLTDWEYRGVMLDVNTPRAAYNLTKSTNPTMERSKTPPSEEIWARYKNSPNVGATIQRPKILYNKTTKKYVLWMHWEDGMGFALSHCAVASSDKPDGPYVYHGSFRPAGFMSRDSTAFQDDDGTAYFISAARDNADFHIYRLTEDYMAIDECVKRIFPDQYREAPALFKRNGVYFLMSSECMGAEPNQCMYSWTRDIMGRWSLNQPIGTPTTYDTQPAFVMSVNSVNGTHYFYVGDRWNPSEFYRNARYIILPLTFPTDTSIGMDWCDEFTIDFETGEITTKIAPTGLIRIRSRCGARQARYLTPAGDSAADGAAVTARRLEYGVDTIMWRAIDADGGYIYFQNINNGLRLTVMPDGGVSLKTPEDSPSQKWKIEELFDGSCRLLTVDGLALNVTVNEGVMECGVAERRAIYDPAWGADSQAFVLTTVYPYA